jgi:hypothetical protein
MRGRKRKIIWTAIIIFLISICGTGLYLLDRSIHIKNNDLLLIYETLKPKSVSEEEVNNSKYVHYFYGEDIGRVIVENDGLGVTVRDEKHGFIKEYRNGVLYYVEDFKKEELISEVKSYFSPRFWLGGEREERQNSGKFIRTVEECRQIGQLLKEKKYDQITADNKNKIIITNNGTYFVN